MLSGKGRKKRKRRKEQLVKVENGDEWVGEVTWKDHSQKKMIKISNGRRYTTLMSWKMKVFLLGVVVRGIAIIRSTC